MDQEITTTILLQTLNKKEILLPTDYGLDALAAILHEAAVEKDFGMVHETIDHLIPSLGTLMAKQKKFLRQ